MRSMLAIQKICKGFNGKPLFKNFSYNFENGCYCIAGKNGVGKTVLLEILAGVQPQDSGSIMLSDIGDNSSIKFKERLVFIPSKPHFFPSTTGREFLNFVLSAKKHTPDIAKIESLINQFNLKEYLDSKFSKMSLGTQKKLFLTTLAIGINSVIILDEPENGLDTQSFNVLCELLKEFKNKAIIVLATHDSTLIEKLSPTVIEMWSGLTN